MQEQSRECCDGNVDVDLSWEIADCSEHVSTRNMQLEIGSIRINPNMIQSTWKNIFL